MKGLGVPGRQLADVWAVGFIDLKASDVNPDALRAIPEDYARANTLIPFDLQADQLQVAMWDPRDHKVIDEIQGTRTTRLSPTVLT